MKNSGNIRKTILMDGTLNENPKTRSKFSLKNKPFLIDLFTFYSQLVVFTSNFKNKPQLINLVELT